MDMDMVMDMGTARMVGRCRLAVWILDESGKKGFYD